MGKAGRRDATIVVTGAAGQIGYEAVRQLAPYGKVVGLTRADLDLGDPAVVGRKLTVNGRPTEVIGVMPERFRLMSFEPAVILPMQFDRGALHLGNFSFQGIARLKPNVSMAQANADVARVAR